METESSEVRASNEPEPVFTPEQEKAIKAIVVSVIGQTFQRVLRHPSRQPPSDNQHSVA